MVRAPSKKEALANAAVGTWVFWENARAKRVFCRLYIAQVVEQDGQKALGPMLHKGVYMDEDGAIGVAKISGLVSELNSRVLTFKKAQKFVQAWEREALRAVFNQMWS